MARAGNAEGRVLRHDDTGGKHIATSEQSSFSKPDQSRSHSAMSALCRDQAQTTPLNERPLAGTATAGRNDRLVKGFGCRPVRDGSDASVGPAFESLQGRKPRDDEALATLPMGISLGGEVLGEGLRCGSTVRRVR
jgi:hypothetical protein